MNITQRITGAPMTGVMAASGSGLGVIAVDRMLHDSAATAPAITVMGSAEQRMIMMMYDTMVLLISVFFFYALSECKITQNILLFQI